MTLEEQKYFVKSVLCTYINIESYSQYKERAKVCLEEIDNVYALAYQSKTIMDNFEMFMECLDIVVAALKLKDSDIDDFINDKELFNNEQITKLTKLKQLLK